MYPVGETSRAVGGHNVRKPLAIEAQVGASRRNRPYDRLEDFVAERLQHYFG